MKTFLLKGQEMIICKLKDYAKQSEKSMETNSFENPVGKRSVAQFAFDAMNSMLAANQNQWHSIDSICLKTRETMSVDHSSSSESSYLFKYENKNCKFPSNRRLRFILMSLDRRYNDRLKPVGYCLEKKKIYGKYYLKLSQTDTYGSHHQKFLNRVWSKTVRLACSLFSLFSF